ncbi:MAG: hypothetical protein ABEJ57_06395, partial [Halobacteriaceae archaeon]
MIRRLLFGAGVAAAVLGLVLIAVPGVAGGVAITELLVYGLGVLALLLAVGALYRRRNTAIAQAETGTPERPTPLPRPGSGVDTRLHNLVRLQSRARLANERTDLDERLEELAIRVIARREDCTRDDARTLLDRGEWTDDRYAAAYFADDIDVPFRDRVRASLGGSVTAQTARHAIEALAETAPSL